MDFAILLITLGCVLLVGLGLDAVGRRTRLPRITLLVLFGLAVGPSGAGLAPDGVTEWYDTTAKLALAMVAFMLGGALSKRTLALCGRAIIMVSVAVSACSFAIVAGGLYAIGAPLALALLLGGISLATDPAATRDVIREQRADGPVTKTVLGVVALDDAWGIIAFSVLLGLLAAGASGTIIESANGAIAGFAHGVADVAGAVAIGLAVGLPGAYATGRIRPGEPTLIEALGIVLLCAGLALWFEVSFLLAAMTAGAVIVNLARHHETAFHEIEHVSGPLLMVFFVLAGAVVDLDALFAVGWLGAAYVACRIAGRLVGGIAGGRLGGLPRDKAWLTGAALMPQAGVALGMALVAAEVLPSHAEHLITLAVATTIFFELLGPVATAVAIRRAGESGRVED